jgi:hypothetical protein
VQGYSRMVEVFKGVPIDEIANDLRDLGSSIGGGVEGDVLYKMGYDERFDGS